MKTWRGIEVKKEEKNLAQSSHRRRRENGDRRDEFDG
jgi:hypothetical protein